MKETGKTKIVKCNKEIIESNIFLATKNGGSRKK